MSIGSIEKILEALDDHLEGDAVLTAFWDDQIRGSLAWLDVAQMHWADGLIVLPADRLEISSPLPNVSSHSSEDANVGIGVDEQFDVEEVAQLVDGEEQNPFDHDHFVGLDLEGLDGSRVGLEVVDRRLDRLSTFQRLELANKELVIQRVGMVEIDHRQLFAREHRLVLVVPVVLDK